MAVLKTVKALLAPLMLAALCSPALAKEKITIAVASTVFDVSQANNTSIPFFTKCWENAGLDVELQPTNANAATQALVTGRVQLVLSAPATAIQARSKGAPIRSVYLNIRRNFYATVVKDDSPIRSLKDFKGKTIGVFSYGTPSYRLLRGALADAGVDPEKDVTFVETGLGAQAISALRSGRVDVWGIWDSQVATAENMGLKLRKFEFPQADKLDWGSSFFATDSFIAKQPETIAKVLRCAAEGTVYTAANPKAAVEAHWKIYPDTKPSSLSDAEALRQAMHIIETRLEYLKLAPGERWGAMPERSAQALIDFMKATGQLTDDVKAADVFTNQFVETINQFDSDAVAKSAKEAK